MKFCPICNNMLMPKNGKLYCRACGEEFELESEDQEDYKSIKRIQNETYEEEPILILNPSSSNKISIDQRKAYEEFFIS